MNTLRDHFKQADLQRFTDYITLGRQLEKLVADHKVNQGATLKVAFLSSSTSNAVKETLISQSSSLGVFPEIYMGEYGQYAQEIFDSQSGLYSFSPQLAILQIDLQSIAGDYFFNPYEKTAVQRKQWFYETVDFILSLVEKLSTQIPVKIVLQNFEVPAYSPLGIIDNKDEFGFIESVEEINRTLRDRFKNSDQVYIYDFNGFCSKVGKDNVIDHKMYHMADIRLKPHLLPQLCFDYARYIQAAASRTKKCIVLDLDNTLWGGIVGEAGPDGIKLGPTPEGRPFFEFQKYLLALHERGIILAINSKNNFDDAIEVIRNHPHMVLKESHFAAMQINWDDKVSNLKSIAAEINIGLDSLVFFDDDKVNRDMVRNLLPEVEVVDLPEDFSLYSSTLKELGYFETLTFTAEDRDKGKMYQAEKQRRELAQSTSDISDYLRMLDINIAISEADKTSIARVSQLTQKTNQFNLTTRRYSEQSISNFLQSDIHKVFFINVRDKFGDNGVTGVAIIETHPVEKNWVVDSFLLSCRILGRNIEDVLITFLKYSAKGEGMRSLQGEFIPTKKNKPAEQFYKRVGFTCSSENEENSLWIFDLENDFNYPDFIHIEIV